jgi:hypothetical protein
MCSVNSFVKSTQILVWIPHKFLCGIHTNPCVDSTQTLCEVSHTGSCVEFTQEFLECTVVDKSLLYSWKCKNKALFGEFFNENVILTLWQICGSDASSRRST